MEIHIQPAPRRFFTIHPNNDLTLRIYRILIEQLHCHVIEFVSKSTENIGLIKAKLPLNKSLKDVVTTLQLYLGGNISYLNNSIFITDGR